MENETDEEERVLEALLDTLPAERVAELRRPADGAAGDDGAFVGFDTREPAEESDWDGMGLARCEDELFEAEDAGFDGRDERCREPSDLPFAYKRHRGEKAKKSKTTYTVQFCRLCLFMTIPFLRRALRLTFGRNLRGLEKCRISDPAHISQDPENYSEHSSFDTDFFF